MTTQIAFCAFRTDIRGMLALEAAYSSSKTSSDNHEALRIANSCIRASMYERCSPEASAYDALLDAINSFAAFARASVGSGLAGYQSKRETYAMLMTLGRGLFHA
jgi:hypothetical protein